MIVACPHCKTTYNLPEDKARPELKLRCTMCKKVFTLADSLAGVDQDDDDDLQLAALRKIKAQGQGDGLDFGPGEDFSINIPTERKKQKKWPLVVVLLLVVLGIGFGILWNKTTVLNPVKTLMGVEIPPTPEELAEMQRLRNEALIKDLGMRNVRQYVVTNEKIGPNGQPGKLIVVEGQVVNESDGPRELIKVEISLNDTNNQPLVRKQQLAGTMVSHFQLQVLSEAELEQALTNKLDIVTNNTNVLPGASVPFMVVLYNPPANGASFDIRVVGADLPRSTAGEPAN